MSGELTLQGHVLPVGGIKEKVLAAHRAGVRRIVLPAQNKQDLHEVSPKVKSQLNFIFVQSADEVLMEALEPLEAAEQQGRAKSSGASAGRDLAEIAMARNRLASRL